MRQSGRLPKMDKSSNSVEKKTENETPLPLPSNYVASVRMTGVKLFKAIKKPRQGGSREH